MTIFGIENSHNFDHRNSRLSQLIQHIRLFWSEAKTRRALRSSLAKLSKKDLRDIGLTRNDVLASCKSPLKRNAARDLSEISNTRAKNW